MAHRSWLDSRGESRHLRQEAETSPRPRVAPELCFQARFGGFLLLFGVLMWPDSFKNLRGFAVLQPFFMNSWFAVLGHLSLGSVRHPDLSTCVTCSLLSTSVKPRHACPQPPGAGPVGTTVLQTLAVQWLLRAVRTARELRASGSYRHGSYRRVTGTAGSAGTSGPGVSQGPQGPKTLPCASGTQPSEAFEHPGCK